MSLARQTSFADLQALPFNSPEQRRQYGAAPQQFVEGWSGDRQTAIVMIHGGCWLNQYDLTHVRPFCSALAELGFPIWSVEYRRVGDAGGGWPGSFEDIQAATLLVAEDYDEMIIMGHSAGGHLALWVAASQPAIFKQCIGLAAISDLVSYAEGTSTCEKATLSLMGGTPEQHADRYAKASPLLLPTVAKSLLIHGAEDSIVRPDQSARFAQAQGAAYTAVAEAGHFDVVNPQSVVWPVITRALMEPG